MENVFNIEPILTKSFIEKFISPEQLMYRYTGLVPTNKLYISPFRKESHGSCSFYVSKSGELLLRDFGSSISYNWINVIKAKFNCGYYKALRIAAEDLGLVRSDSNRVITKLIDIPKLIKNITNIQVQLKDYNDVELRWWETFNITKDILDYFNVYSVDTVFINGNINRFSSLYNPIYTYYLGKKNDIELHKIYMPYGSKSYRFLTNAKENVIQGWKQCKESKSDYIVVTKSMKDNMCLYSFGITAISPNSETVFLPDNHLTYLKNKFKKIFILFDTDLTGVRFMNKIRKKYSFIKVLMIPRKYGTKDISDFCKKYGPNKTRELINRTINEIN
jgi:hypothetical protein